VRYPPQPAIAMIVAAAPARHINRRHRTVYFFPSPRKSSIVAHDRRSAFSS
jgi:hypothetical protein